jgi:ABC-type transport system involved in multi-copper enzyme maturation permease subunit
MISIGFVSVLGFQQAITEEWRGTYKLLLHRPLDRRAIFFAKAAAGLGLYLLLGTLSILAVAVWAATPGMQPAPFFWSMTLPTFGALLAITMVYLGAFVSGLRPARWYATRLFPWLVSVVLCYLVLAGIFAVPMLVLGLGLLVANFLVIATTREFA